MDIRKLSAKVGRLIESKIHLFPVLLLGILMVAVVTLSFTDISQNSSDYYKGSIFETSNGMAASFTTEYTVVDGDNQFTVQIDSSNILQETPPYTAFEVLINNYDSDKLSYIEHTVPEYYDGSSFSVYPADVGGSAFVEGNTEPRFAYVSSAKDIISGELISITFEVNDIASFEETSFNLAIKYSSVAANYVTEYGEVVISRGNSAPVMTEGFFPDEFENVEDEYSGFNLSGAASDPDDGDSITWSIQEFATSSGFSMESYYIEDNNLVHFYPGENLSGYVTLKMRATDESGLFAESELITLSWSPDNDRPELLETFPDSLQGEEDEWIVLENLDDYVYDPDSGDTFEWAFLNTGTGIGLESYNIEDDSLYIKANSNAYGDRNNIRLKVRDNNGSDWIESDAFIASWLPVNDAPEIYSLNAGNISQVEMNTNIELIFTAVHGGDIDDDFSDLNWEVVSIEDQSGVIASSSSQPSSNQTTFIFEPVVGTVGSVDVSFVLKDDETPDPGVSTEETITLVWTDEVNVAPEWKAGVTIDPISLEEEDEDTTIELYLDPNDYAEDGNYGDKVHWEINGDLDDNIFESVSSVSGNTFTFDPVDNYFNEEAISVPLKICDMGGECIEGASIDIIWNSFNDIPTMNDTLSSLVTEVSGVEGTTIQIEFSDEWVTDVEDEEFSWSIEQVDGQEELFIETADNYTFTISTIDSDFFGTVNINVIATDSDEGSVTDDTLVLEWTGENDAPVFIDNWQSLVAGVSVEEGSNMTLVFTDNMVTDLEGDDIFWSVSTDSQLVKSIDSMSTPEFTIIPEDYANGAVSLSVTISDGVDSIVDLLEVGWTYVDDSPVWIDYPGAVGRFMISADTAYTFNLTDAIEDPDSNIELNLDEGAYQSMASYNFTIDSLPGNSAISTDVETFEKHLEWTPDMDTQGGEYFDFSVNAYLGSESAEVDFSMGVYGLSVSPMLQVVSATATSNTIVEVLMDLDIDSDTVQKEDFTITSGGEELEVLSASLKIGDLKTIVLGTVAQSDTLYSIKVENIVSNDGHFDIVEGGITKTFTGIEYIDIANAPGNCNGNTTVSLDDVMYALEAYVSGEPSQICYDNCDLVEDFGLIDMFDILAVYDLVLPN